jgi:uncharacterized membrane protein YidH (DUF202 family)
LLLLRKKTKLPPEIANWCVQALWVTGLPRISSQKARTRSRSYYPVRVEPKVFFANETTFLAWLHSLIILGALALGLLNFGDKFSKVSGVVLTVIAMLFMFYALYMYLWRAYKIRARGIFC